MPRLFKIGSYIIFFWSNENNEPIHIHIAQKPSENATKIWLTRGGGYLIANNGSKIPNHELNDLLELLPTYYLYICSQWKKYFNLDDIKFYC